MLKKLVFVLFSLAVIQTSSAASRFVIDELWLQLRTGPSSEYRIIKAVKSGDRLKILKDDKESGYSQVRTQEGAEGWVLTRFLDSKPIARVRLSQAETKIKELTEELEAAKTQLDEVVGKNSNLNDTSSTLARKNEQLTQELNKLKKISKNAVALSEKAQKLTKRNQEIEIRMQTLEAENTQMISSRQKDFLLYGGGLVIAGIIAGLLLPALRGKKSDSGWS